MLVIDEYLAVDVAVGDWPAGLPDDELMLPVSRYFRLLQRIHNPGTGQLSEAMRDLSPRDRDSFRHPDSLLVQVLDPRRLLDRAAAIGARYSTGGLLMTETLAAGLDHGRQLWFGAHRNVGPRLSAIAEDLRIAIHVVVPPGEPPGQDVGG